MEQVTQVVTKLVHAKKAMEDGVAHEVGNVTRKDLHALAELAKSGALKRSETWRRDACGMHG